MSLWLESLAFLLFVSPKDVLFLLVLSNLLYFLGGLPFLVLVGRYLRYLAVLVFDFLFLFI